MVNRFLSSSSLRDFKNWYFINHDISAFAHTEEKCVLLLHFKFQFFAWILKQVFSAKKNAREAEFFRVSSKKVKSFYHNLSCEVGVSSEPVISHLGKMAELKKDAGKSGFLHVQIWTV